MLYGQARLWMLDESVEKPESILDELEVSGCVVVRQCFLGQHARDDKEWGVRLEQELALCLMLLG